MTDERVTVFDADGVVVGTAPRSQVYAEGLWHGSAGVLVRSTDGGRLYVHRRTLTRAVFAGMHDCLAGGVIDPGETPLATATRELREELGIDPQQIFDALQRQNAMTSAGFIETESDRVRLRVTGEFGVRGGIYTNVVAEHRKKGWKPDAPVQLP